MTNSIKEDLEIIQRKMDSLRPFIEAEKRIAIRNMLAKVMEIAEDNSFTFKGRQGGPYIEISLLRRIIDKELK